MNPMKTAPRIAAFLAGVLVAAGAIAADKAAAPTVEVTWTNPADMSDAKTTPAGTGIGRPTPKEWLGELAKQLKWRAASVLAPGQTLDVKFTDVQRAGIYEPWRGPQWDDIRVIKAQYPPRIDLTFTLRDADGRIVREGERKLRDPAFLQRSAPNHTDALRYEKRLLDDWVRKEFGRPK